MEMFKKVFNGDERLVITFWVWGVVVYIILAILAGVILGLLGLATPLAIYIVMLLYSIFIWVGIWRSSDKYTGQKVWAILAKIMVALSVLGTIMNFINPTPMPWS